MDFKIVGEITHIETIAVGSGIRDRARLRKRYGIGRWRKRKGVARVRLLEVVVKWIEDKWGKGSVDETLLEACLKDPNVFGGVVPPPPPPPPPGTFVIVTAGDFEHKPALGKGIFVYKAAPSKRIDVSLSGPDLERQMERLGFRTSTRTAFGAFRWNLRREAGLV